MTIYTPGSPAYAAQEPSVATASTGPAPYLGTSYFYAGTSDVTAYQRWALDGQAAWRFRRMVWLGASSAVDLDFLALRVGADATNQLTVRSQSTGLLRLVATGSATVWTSTAPIPTSGWYRLEGYGNGVNNTARIALFSPESTTPLAGLDSGLITAAQGSIPATGVRLGKTSNAVGYTSRTAWQLDDFRTGTDAPEAFIGPYATVTQVGATTVTGNSTQTTSRAVAVPAGAAVGDVAFVFLDLWNTATTVTPPTGFTQLYAVTGGTGVRNYAYWKRLTAADTGTYAFTWTASNFATCSCTLLRGVVTSGDPTGLDYTTGYATSTTFPPLTESTAYAPALLWHGYNDSAATHTPPTGFVETADVDCATDAISVAGSSGSYTAANGAATVSSALFAGLVAVQPATVTGPPFDPAAFDSATFDNGLVALASVTSTRPTSWAVRGAVTSTRTASWSITLTRIAFVSQNSAALVSTNATETLTIPAPPGLVEGNALVATIYQANSTSGPIVASGWTVAGQAVATTDPANTSSPAGQMWVLTRPVTATEPTGYAFGFNVRSGTSYYLSGTVLQYSGTTGSPVGPVSFTVSDVAAASVTAPSVTAGSSSVLLAAFGSFDGAVITVPAVTTERSVARNAGNVGMTVADDEVEPGATGTRTATFSPATKYIAASTVLVPSVGGVVTSTRATSWAIRTSATSTRSASWDTETAATSNRAASWSVLTPVTAARVASWSVLTPTSASRSTLWAVRTPVTAARAASWSVLTSVSSARVTSWAATAAVTVTRAASWSVATSATSARQSTWTALQAVSGARGASWSVLTPVASTRAASWSVAGTISTVSTARSTSWSVLSTTTATRAASWSTAASLTSTRSTSWSALAATSATRLTSWAVRTPVAAARPTSWSVLTPASSARLASWAVRTPVVTVRAASWSVLTGTTATRVASWSTLTLASSTRVASWSAAARVTSTRSTSWYVDTTGQVSSTRSTSWSTAAAVVTARQASWSVTGTVSAVTASRTGTWSVLTPVNSARAASWSARTAVTATRATSWAALQLVATNRTGTWAVLVPVVTARQASWSVAGTAVTVSSTRSTSWSLAARVNATRQTSWSALAPVTAVRTGTWSALVPVATARPTSWVARQLVTAARVTSWSVLAVVTSPRGTSWAVLLRVTATRTAGWRVTDVSAVTISRETRWVTRSTVTVARAATWRILLLVPRHTYRLPDGNTVRPPANGTARPGTNGTVRPDGGSIFAGTTPTYRP